MNDSYPAWQAVMRTAQKRRKHEERLKKEKMFPYFDSVLALCGIPAFSHEGKVELDGVTLELENVEVVRGTIIHATIVVRCGERAQTEWINFDDETLADDLADLADAIDTVTNAVIKA